MDNFEKMNELFWAWLEHMYQAEQTIDLMINDKSSSKEEKTISTHEFAQTILMMAEDILEFVQASNQFEGKQKAGIINGMSRIIKKLTTGFFADSQWVKDLKEEEEFVNNLPDELIKKHEELVKKLKNK